MIKKINPQRINDFYLTKRFIKFKINKFKKMPVVTLLNKIKKNNYKPFKKWTLNGSGGLHYNSLKDLKQLFDLLSGNESLKMLNDVLKLYKTENIPNKYFMVF